MTTLPMVFLFGLNLAIVISVGCLLTLAISWCFRDLSKRYAALAAGAIGLLLAPALVAANSCFSLGSLPAIALPGISQTVADVDPRLSSTADHASQSVENFSAKTHSDSNDRMPEALLSEVAISDAPRTDSVARQSDRQTHFESDVVMAPVDSVAIRSDAPVSDVDKPNVRPSETTWSAFRLAASGLLLIWLAGTLSLLIRQGVRIIRCRRFVKTCRPVTDECVHASFSRVAQQLGVSGRVELLESDVLPAPVVVKFGRPKVILPADVQLSLSSRQLAAVMAHELSHVARRDYVVVRIQAVTGMLYWWNPLVHVMSKRMNVLRELICDDVAVTREAAPDEYARSLVQLAEHAVSRHIALSSLGVSLSGVSEMEQRVRRVLSTSVDRRSTGLTRRFVVGLSMLCATMLTGLLFAQMPTAAAVDEVTSPAAATANDSTNPATTTPSTELNTAIPTESDKTTKADEEEKKTEEDEAPLLKLSGRIIDSEGNPAQNATVYLHGNSYHPVDKTVTANAHGEFQIDQRLRMEDLPYTSLRATSADGTLLGYLRFPYQSEDSNFKLDQIEIKLVPIRTAKIQVVNGNGDSIPDANVALQFSYPIVSELQKSDADGFAAFQLPESEKVLAAVAWKDGEGLDYQLYVLPYEQKDDQLSKAPEFPFESAQTLTLEGAAPFDFRVVDQDNQPLANVDSSVWLLTKESQSDQLNLSYFNEYFTQKSDEAGRTTFAWFPAWQTRPVTVWATASGFVHTRGKYNPALDEGKTSAQLQRQVPIRGRVTFPDDSPAPDITVAANGAGYAFDDFLGTATTNAEGRYEILVDPNQIYLLTVNDKTWGAPSQSDFAVLPGHDIPDHDFQLTHATRIHGRVLDKDTGEPVAGNYIYFQCIGTPLNELKDITLPNPEKSRRSVKPFAQFNLTSPDGGTFEFFVGDGDYMLFVDGNESQKFTINGEKEKQVDLLVKVIREIEFTGTVVNDVTGEPVGNASIQTASQNFNSGKRDWAAATDGAGRFSVKRPVEPVYLHVTNQDRTLGAVVAVAADDKQANIRLRPLGSATGRLMSEDGRTPASRIKLRTGIRITDIKGSLSSNRFGATITTDADGHFELTHLAPGWEYECQLADYPGGRVVTITKAKVDPNQALDLGELKTPTAPKPYVPPTLDERISQAFDVAGTPTERFERAKEIIRTAGQNLMIVFGQASDTRVHRLMEIRYEDKDFRKHSDDYRVMAIPTDPPRAAAAAELARTFRSDVDFSTPRDAFVVVLLNQAAEPLAVLDSSNLCVDDQFSKERLFEQLEKFKTTRLNAKTLLDDALKQALAENKRVLVQETATWCGPCHQLTHLLDDHRQWEKDYVWVRMDHRWTGAQEIMKTLRGDAEGGIPWFAILDDHGNRLATSNIPATGDNIGFPSEESGQQHFKNMLMQTRQRMTDQEIENLVKAAGRE
ncbi:MAG: M56 family metallopeptidase [Planctomycetaceae bacterium]